MGSETTFTLNASRMPYQKSRTTLKNVLTVYMLNSLAELHSLLAVIRINFHGFTEFCLRVHNLAPFRGTRYSMSSLSLTFRISQQTLSSLGGSLNNSLQPKLASILLRVSSPCVVLVSHLSKTD